METDEVLIVKFLQQYDYKMEKDLKKLPRRRMQVGKYKMKKVYKEDGAKEVC